MADYFSTLSSAQKSNIAYIVKRMNDKGITNPLSQAGILSIVSKESGFVPKNETSYKNTDNNRIRSIFGKLRNYSDADLNILKNNDELFFNAIYGGMYGNASNEGYKYRGRGFNQLTFKGNYEAVGKKIGVDLVNNPDKVNQLQTATDVLLQYFIDKFNSAPPDKLNAYNTNDINGFKNIEDSIGAFYHANAGWGKSVSSVKNDGTGGFIKAKDRANGFYDMINTGNKLNLFFLKRVWSKPMGKVAIIGTIVLIGGLTTYLVLTNLKNK